MTTTEVETRFGERTLPFEDPGDLQLALVETEDEREFVPWEHSPVPAEHQVRGMHAVWIWQHKLEPTEALLTEVQGLDTVDGNGGTGTGTAWRVGAPGRSRR